jgi:hypothetical protein
MRNDRPQSGISAGVATLRAPAPSKLAKEVGLSRPATTRQLRVLQRDGRGRELGPISAWFARTEVGCVSARLADALRAADGSA